MKARLLISFELHDASEQCA